jgi:5'(3')-deoxyribonucleotidase
MATIYVDMDGVVADFDGFARQKLDSKKFNSALDRWEDSEWQRLREVPNLYRQLPKMHKADLMMLKAQRFVDDLGWDMYMLTAIPHKNDIPDCQHDKILWMQEYYPDVRVRFGPYSVDKQHHCLPGDILIDDRPQNCEQWRAAGGRAVQVSADYDQALRDLDQLYQDIRSLLNLRSL